MISFRAVNLIYSVSFKILWPLATMNCSDLGSRIISLLSTNVVALGYNVILVAKGCIQSPCDYDLAVITANLAPYLLLTQLLN